MIKNHPNIWMQYTDGMAEILSSVDAACEENREMVIFPDSNLNRLTSCDKDYPKKGLKDQLMSCLARMTYTW